MLLQDGQTSPGQEVERWHGPAFQVWTLILESRPWHAVTVFMLSSEATAFAACG